MINRRSFIKHSGLLTFASLLPVPAFTRTGLPKYKMGLQVFTIRDAMDKDVVGTLKQVKALGYEDLELYGFDPERVAYYGYKATDFKSLLDDLGLTASSCHYNFAAYFDKSGDELKRYVDQCIKGARLLNMKYITWPWVDPKHRNPEGYKKLAEKLNRLGEQVKAANLGFAYHNHGYEFEDLGGQTGYDLVIQRTDPDLVKLQLDFYWVKHSSLKSPQQWIRNQEGRVVMWHLKDMDKVTRDYTELGNGSIDYVEILSTIDTSSLEYYYLEQGGNFADNSMQSIADSAKFFKKNLQQYL